LPAPIMALTALALWALRSGVSEGSDIAFRSADAPMAAGYLNDWVPLRIDAGLLDRRTSEAQSAVQNEAALCARHGGFARDLIARDPKLQSLTTPDLAICMDTSHGPIDGAALCFVVQDTSVTLHYDAARVPADHAARLVARLEVLAAALVDDAPARSLPILPDAERHHLLESWNATQTEFDANFCMHRQFEAQVARTPDAPALVFEHDILSYAELNARANRAAHVLRDMGVTRGALVGLCTRRSPDLVVGALAILKAGGAYVPLDPAYPDDRLAHYIADSGCGVIITQASLATDLPPHQAQVLELDTDTRLSAASDVNPTPVSGGEDLAYLIYTSGSTGTPKGVMVEHGNVANFFVGMDARVPHQAGDTWLAVTSLSF
ncbi:AMP-binding protein, partial [Roseobacter sp.]|uniref:AMP-binding protein n=1 Tax=Roseobacter sp. TaxID=1907202 RepID=UPI0032975944